MKKIELFEPAMCCDTGICGPAVDPNLLRITAVFQVLEKNEQITAERFNLTSKPQAFIEHPEVALLIKEKGMAILPVTMFDGEIVKTGTYPTNEEITAFTAIDLVGVHKPRKILKVEKPKKKTPTV